jgi:hypothetical protein
MDIDLSTVFDDPARRRFWLLTKALEDAPLEVALCLAMSAEAFVTGRAEASQERAIASYWIGLQLSASVH